MTSDGAGAFVVLVGIDGAGKTSVKSALKAMAPQLVPVSWQDYESLREADPLPQAATMSEAVDRMGGFTRAAFLALLLAQEYEAGVAPGLRSGATMLVDSYWYKIVAREVLLGKAAGWLEAACRGLPDPDLVLFLDVPPAVARERKSAFSSVESPGGAAAFVAFQTEVRAKILGYIRQLPVVRLPTDSPAAAARAALDALDALPGPGRHRGRRR